VRARFSWGRGCGGAQKSFFFLPTNNVLGIPAPRQPGAPGRLSVARREYRLPLAPALPFCRSVGVAVRPAGYLCTDVSPPDNSFVCPLSFCSFLLSVCRLFFWARQRVQMPCALCTAVRRGHMAARRQSRVHRRTARQRVADTGGVLRARLRAMAAAGGCK
jgi:hypothetical protein